jgi:ribosomal protein S28E/S33
MTILRGRVIAEEGRIMGEADWGRVIDRAVPAPGA